MSAVKEFVNDRVEHLNYVPEDIVEKKVTVRIPEDAVNDLDEVASKLRMTRSGLAADLLCRAIKEAVAAVEAHPEMKDVEGIDRAILARIAEEEEAQESKVTQRYAGGAF